MTRITPSLLAAAYTSIRLPNAPRISDLSVIGVAAAEIPPVTTSDTIFPDNASLSPEATLSGALAASATRASSSVGAQSPVTVFGSSAPGAPRVSGSILDIVV